MYSEVEMREDEHDTLDDSETCETLPLIPLSALKRRSVKPPSAWTVFRVWLSIKLARWAYRIAP
jgi:hypothetical protein